MGRDKRATDETQNFASQQEGRFTAPLQVSLAAATDEDPAGSRYRVSFIRAGYVRRRDGQAAAWRIPPETLAMAAPLLEGRAVFLDHAGPWDYPSLRNLIGITGEPEYNPLTESIDGYIRLYDSESGQVARQLLKQVLADQMAGREAPDVGLSLVFYGRHEYVEMGQEAGGEQAQDFAPLLERVTTEIKFVESCDLVFGPGADGRVKEALSAAALNFSEQTPGGAQPPGAQDKTVGGVTMEPVEVQQETQNIAPQTQNIASQQLNSEESGPATPPAQPAAPALEERLARLEQGIDRLTAALAAREQVVEGLGRPPVVQGMQTGIERFAPNIDWLFGVPGAPYPDPQFRRADMIYQALTGDWEWRGVFNPDRVMLAGANTTDLPALAVNAMNKVIGVAWASLRAYRWYEFVTAVVPNDGSTQPMTWVGSGGIEVLPVVAEKGPYTELSMDDTGEQDDFTKYGGYVGITLEMFRRSEIAKIQAVPQGLARSAVMKRSANIASIFTANAGTGPVLDSDTKALFHNDHGNVATTAFGTDSTAWNAVDLIIWNQTELGSNKPLAISPKYMLCNRSLYRAALVVFGYGDGQPTTYIPEAMDRGPDDPRPWPIAVPDFTDANDWAAVVDPKVYPVIMMSYAQSTGGGAHPTPELYAVTSETQGLVFTNDVLPVKVRDWYAFGVNGYRGIAKRNVA